MYAYICDFVTEHNSSGLHIYFQMKPLGNPKKDFFLQKSQVTKLPFGNLFFKGMLCWKTFFFSFQLEPNSLRN